MYLTTAPKPQLSKLEQAIRMAKRQSSPDHPLAVFNLNTIGAALYVVRAADSFVGENRLVAGPFVGEA
jgi:hypothetical protein